MQKKLVLYLCFFLMLSGCLFAQQATVSPQLVGRCYLGDVGYDVRLKGPYALVANRSVGLVSIDFSNKTRPSIVGSCQFSDYAFGVEVVGNYAYVSAGASGFHVVDVTAPASPVTVGTYNTPGYARSSKIKGIYAYVADGGSMQILNIANPKNPQYIGSYTCTGLSALALTQSYAYLADYTDFKVLDITKPDNPKLVAKCAIGDLALHIDVSGSYAYVLKAYDGVKVIDISNPENPKIVGSFTTQSSTSTGIYVIEPYAYVADQEFGLKVLDISSPYKPKSVGTYRVDGYASRVYVQDGYAYVTDDCPEYAALYIITGIGK